ncbi:stage II sporulation protein M [Carnobacterium jeotgali]|uniref:stage II sporulation protein M n=1 Tax=Carnobacterium jeotgali TaxID=545534 RepID=UPI0004937641|nr:stage II sporulation protein M [Carnobacterium jeotgali]
MLLYLSNKTIFKRASKFFLFLTSLSIVIALITYMFSLNISNIDFIKIFESIGDNEQLIQLNGIQKVEAYILNNGFKVPLQMLILSTIPIQFLYLLNIIIPAALIGVAFGIILQVDLVKGIQVLVSSMPYYIVEVFAFCLFAAILYELNQFIRIKIKNIFKKNKEKISFTNRGLEAVKLYALFILPMLIFAAFLETYLAEILFVFFQ